MFLVSFFSSDQCGRAQKTHKVPKRKKKHTHCLNMLSSTRTRTHRTYSTGHTTTHCFVSRGCTHFLRRRTAQLIPLLPWLFLCLESIVTFVFLSFSQEKLARDLSHCNVCVFVFFHMSKINAGGRRETSNKHAQALRKLVAYENF